MKRKMTPDELRAWYAARTARIEELRQHIARLEAELARKRKPA
jgi:uncharacterized small protein (DUF1192 family)